VYIFHALKHSEPEKMKMEQAEMQSPAAGSAGVENLQAEETQEPAPATETSPENGDLAELKAQAAKAKEHWDLLLRTTADFDNFKKRAARERQDAIRYANESLLQKLIPVLDSFDMAANATAAANSTESSNQSLQAGISMILTQLRSALAEGGLEEIEAANKAFDPNFHEAVAQQETADVPEGHVVQQLRKGYKLRDRLLRPATVVVAKKPAA
jgi:molecular chaperone GrpE